MKVLRDQDNTGQRRLYTKKPTLNFFYSKRDSSHFVVVSACKRLASRAVCNRVFRVQYRVFVVCIWHCIVVVGNAPPHPP